MRRLHDLSGRVSSMPDLASVLAELLKAAIELQAADFGHAQLYEDAASTLRIVAHQGEDRRFVDCFETIDAGDASPFGLALRSGSHIVVEDVHAGPDHEPWLGMAAATGCRGVHSIPLIDRDTARPIGMVSTFFRAPYRSSKRQRRLSDLYAGQAPISGWCGWSSGPTARSDGLSSAAAPRTELPDA